MSRPSTIKRRCQKCGELYEIPNIRKSPRRDLILVCYPCPCGYSQCDTKSGSCVDCRVPFRIKPHHALGRCKSDHRKFLRANATKPAAGDTLLRNG